LYDEKVFDLTRDGDGEEEEEGEVSCDADEDDDVEEAMVRFDDVAHEKIVIELDLLITNRVLQ